MGQVPRVGAGRNDICTSVYASVHGIYNELYGKSVSVRRKACACSPVSWSVIHHIDKGINHEKQFPIYLGVLANDLIANYFHFITHKRI